MKQLFAIFLALLLSLSIVAQDFDRMTIADTDIQGTARYVAMSGAFAALGGDVSAVQDNPAALGVFRRSELSITSDWQYSIRQTNNPEHQKIDRMWDIPQISWVWNFGQSSKQVGLIYNSLILQYHRIKSYSNTTRLASTQINSYTDWMAISANQQNAHPTDMGTGVWNNPNIGWLSALGANVNLIDTVGNVDNWQWTSILGQNERVNSDLEVRESGGLDAYTLGWGGNINNRIYVGISANIQSLNYAKRTNYAELFEAGGKFSLQSTFQARGIGFNAATGVIYRPLQFLRLGASIQTPSWMNVQTANYANIKTEGLPSLTKEASTYSCEGHYRHSEFILPMRIVTGVAFQIGNIGLISLEYDYTHAIDQATTDIHWMRAGTEWIIRNNWFLRAGYAYKSDFGASKDIQLLWSYNTTRTDMDFRIKQWDQYLSAGFGYRNQRWIVDIAYQCHLNKLNHSMMEDWNAHEIDNQNHRIVFTFGWTKR